MSCGNGRPHRTGKSASRLGQIAVLLARTGAAACLTAAGAPACDDAALQLTPDYQYLIGSARFTDPTGAAETGSTFRWLRHGTTFLSGPVAEGLLLPFEGSAAGANGELPATAQSLQFTNGKWGRALALPAAGRLVFPRTNNLPLDQGTIELWVALRADGQEPGYASRDHVLLHYRAPNGDSLSIAQSRSGILYAGGTVSNQWQSAYGGQASMRSWRAGQWHHLAFTYSAPESFMRFYMDGVLTAANNEGHYWAPANGGSTFAVGGDVWGTAAFYFVDELRISGRVADAAEVAARAQRTGAPQPNEVWLPTAGLGPADLVVFEFTPATATNTGAACASPPLVFPGIPITNAQPPSTLLPAGATSVDLTVDSTENTTCAYAVGQALPYDLMTRFTQGAGTPHHQTRVEGLNPDPNLVNDVYVRCAAHPDYVFRLRYRALSLANPPFPRKGNLWGWWQWIGKGLPYLAKVDLWLGASPRPEEVTELRRLNPHLRVLTSINAVENSGLPADFYLKDVRGNRIEVWPGSYRLNLTKPYVAEYQARFAYQTVLDTGLMTDGVFFDNVMTTQSWQTHDIYGNPVQIDADEDGIPDDPKAFDAAWKAGVFHEIRFFRQLMPSALVNGHSMDIYEPGIAELFDGISIGFGTANVLEGEESFAALWHRYHDWHARARPPVAVMVESSPRDQIAYGYDYSPLEKIPPPTLEFARTYYPDVRFGLAFTLMADGFFAHEYGDTWHGNDWWYDELDFNLGYPLGPAQRIDFPDEVGTNLIVNGSFEVPIAQPWRFSAGSGCVAALTRDTNGAPVGTACARVAVTATTGTDWHIEFAQYSRSLVQGVSYDFSFRARSSGGRYLTVGAQKSSPDWDGYGLWQRLWVTHEWRDYTATFIATATVTDARLQFFLGETNGTVWLDDVRLTRHPPDVYRRDFTHGTVLLNGTRVPRDIGVGAGFHRLTGTQAPLYEMILDDADPGFTTTGTWTNVVYDSGEWKAAGPFFHSWAGSLHERTGGSGEARWTLPLEAPDTYTIAAWWPAAPAATNWSPNVRAEIIAGGQVVGTTLLDQTRDGDQWHAIATVVLTPADQPAVRFTASSGVVVADALHVTSLSRYNNGQPADRIRLQPMDGILLQRDHPVPLPPKISNLSYSPGRVELTLTNLTPGVTNEVQRSTNLAVNAWTATTAFQPTGTGTNVTDTVSPDLNKMFYRLQAE